MSGGSSRYPPELRERAVRMVAEVKRLRQENAELRRANTILKTASAFFAAELDRPQH
jgi:transposase-like protein